MKINKTSKIFLLIMIVLVVYFVILVVENVFFFKQQTMMDMMKNSNQALLGNVAALIISVGAGFFASMHITEKPAYIRDLHQEKRKIIKEMKEKELKIIKRALTKDESLVISHIEQSGEITQDSLRARLGWSKAKTSTILTNLDRLNLIQRRRQGKTYSVFLSKTTA